MTYNIKSFSSPVTALRRIISRDTYGFNLMILVSVIAFLITVGLLIPALKDLRTPAISQAADSVIPAAGGLVIATTPEN